MFAIEDILKKKGSIDQSELLADVQAKLLREGESLVRATFYNNQKRLEEHGRIERKFFDLQGGRLPDDLASAIVAGDSNAPGAYKCTVSLLGRSSEIRGAGDVERFGGGRLFTFSDELSDEIRISRGVEDSISSEFNFIFSFNDHFFSFPLVADMMPLDFVVAGLGKDFDYLATPQELKEKFSRRLILLTLPDRAVSRIDSKNNKFGHLHFRFSKDLTQVEVFPLSEHITQQNPITVEPLRIDRVKSIKETLMLKDDVTRPLQNENFTPDESSSLLAFGAGPTVYPLPLGVWVSDLGRVKFFILKNM